MDTRSNNNTAQPMSSITWMDWNQPAFDQARQQNRPVFLYLTVSWSRRVHEFEQQVLASDMVKELIGERYIPVRVNALLRPDVFERYNQGGWPSVCLLTPDGALLHGRATATAEQMSQTLQQVADFYQQQHKQIAARAAEQGSPVLPRLKTPKPGDPTDPAPLEGIRHDAFAHYDTRYHGFGRAPKFPMDELILFLLEDQDEELQRLGLTNLEALRISPLHDILGGGFHRFAELETWGQPHFEKLIYNNLVLLEAYSEAYRITSEDRFYNVANGIIYYLESVLIDPNGFFHAAQDSQYDPEDPGDYYGWTQQDVADAVEEDEDLTAVALTYFGISPWSRIAGDPDRSYLEERVDPRQIAMRVARPEEAVTEMLVKARDKMKTVREDRDHPPVDPVILTGDQGRAMSAFGMASLSLNNPRLLHRAFEIADSLWDQCRVPSAGVSHVPGTDENSVFLTDQADVILGYLQLYRIAGRGKDLVRAVELLRDTFDTLGDPEGVGCLDHNHQEDEIGAVASPYAPFEPNSRLLNAVAMVSALTQSEKWHTKALELSDALAQARLRNRLHDAAYGRALRYLVHPPPMVDLIGTETGALRRRIIQEAPPETLVRAFDPEQATPWTPAASYEHTADPVAEAVLYINGRRLEPMTETDMILQHLNEAR